MVSGTVDDRIIINPRHLSQIRWLTMSGSHPSIRSGQYHIAKLERNSESELVTDYLAGDMIHASPALEFNSININKIHCVTMCCVIYEHVNEDWGALLVNFIIDEIWMGSCIIVVVLT